MTLGSKRYLATSVGWALDLRMDWQILFQETEKLLDEWKHPDPNRTPASPAGMYCYAAPSAAGLLLMRPRQSIREEPPCSPSTLYVDRMCLPQSPG